MALDTRNKRASAINIGSPWRGILPLPDGTIETGDRYQLAFLYSGLQLTYIEGAEAWTQELHATSWAQILRATSWEQELRPTTWEED